MAKSQLIDVKHARRRFALPVLRKFRLGFDESYREFESKNWLKLRVLSKLSKGKISCKLCSQKMDLVAQSNEWINKPGTMGRSQSDLPTTRTDQLQNQARSRRTNSLGKVQTASDSDLAAQGQNSKIQKRPIEAQQATRPMNQATSRPVNQPVNQTVNQPVNRPPANQQKTVRPTQNTQPQNRPLPNTATQSAKPSEKLPNQPVTQKLQESSIGATMSKPPVQQTTQQKMAIGSSIGK